MSFNKNKNVSNQGIIVLMLFCFIVVTKVSANEQLALATEQDLFSDFSVTSATRLAQSPRDLPVSVTVIDRKMIEASGATEIPDLFRMVPGFRVAMITGGDYGVFGHGSSKGTGRNLEVLIDGLPVQSPVVNIVDWLSLPIEIEDIEYIEVMRGTSVAVYGSNAFDGAINIVTKKPFEQQGMAYRVTAGDGLEKYQVKYAFGSGGTTHSISAISKNSTGFDNVTDDSDNIKLTYNGNFNPSVNDELNVMLSVNESFVDAKSPAGFSRPRDLVSNHQYIEWKNKKNVEEEFILRLYHHYYKYDDTHSLGLISGLYGISPALVPVFFNGHADQEIIFSTRSAKSNRYGMDVQKNYSYRDIRLAVGANLVYDKLSSEYLFGDKKNISGLSRQIFTNLEWQVKDYLILNAGLLAEKIEDRDTEISHRLSLNYHLNKNNTIRIGGARSIRGRSVYSANFHSVARYAIDEDVFGSAADVTGYDIPEVITTYELAQLVTMPSLNIGFDWRLFRDVYDDVRTTVNDPSYPEDAGTGALVSVNGGRYSVKGLELQLKYAPSDKNFVALHYTRTDSEGKIVSNLAGTSFDDYSDAMPKYSFGVMFGVNINDSLDLGMTYTKISDLNWRSDNNQAGELPGYDRLDIKLSYRFKNSSSNGKVELIAQNILDDYPEYFESNIFDTRILLRVSLEN